MRRPFGLFGIGPFGPVFIAQDDTARQAGNDRQVISALWWLAISQRQQGRVAEALRTAHRRIVAEDWTHADTEYVRRVSALR